MQSWTRFARVQLFLAQLLTQFGPFTRAQVPGRRRLRLARRRHCRPLAFDWTLWACGHTQFAPQLLTLELAVGLAIKLAIPAWRPARARLRKSSCGWQYEQQQSDGNAHGARITRGRFRPCICPAGLAETTQSICNRVSAFALSQHFDAFATSEWPLLQIYKTQGVP